MFWFGDFSGFQDGVIQAVETSKGRLCGHESLNYSGFCECFALLILQQTYPKTVEINWFSKLSRKLYIYRNGGFSIPMSVYWRIKATLKQSACLNRYPPKMDPLGIEKNGY